MSLCASSRGRWKLVHHVGYAPQLFDLESDAEETTGLASFVARQAAQRDDL